jgi:hypothetical protein
LPHPQLQKYLRYADPSSKLNAGKSYVVFGKQGNTDVINLSAIAAGTGGFVINGESMGDHSGWSVVLVPKAMADKLMTSVLFCLPNTTYDLPAFDLLLEQAQTALLSMASQRMMRVVTQSPAQAMLTAMA